MAEREPRREQLLAVGVNGPQFTAHWQSAELPAPTVTVRIETRPGRNGWLLVAREPEPGHPDQETGACAE
jgi:hypothetical protein